MATCICVLNITSSFDLSKHSGSVGLVLHVTAGQKLIRTLMVFLNGGFLLLITDRLIVKSKNELDDGDDSAFVACDNILRQAGL